LVQETLAEHRNDGTPVVQTFEEALRDEDEPIGVS
jgi:hypothetical protein